MTITLSKFRKQVGGSCLLGLLGVLGLRAMFDSRSGPGTAEPTGRRALSWAGEDKALRASKNAKVETQSDRNLAECDDAVIIGDYCIFGSPEFDLGAASTCAYCGTDVEKSMVSDDTCYDAVIDVGDYCIPEDPEFDPASMVCPPSAKDADGYCPYDLALNACAYCSDNPDTRHLAEELSELEQAAQRHKVRRYDFYIAEGFKEEDMKTCGQLTMDPVTGTGICLEENYFIDEEKFPTTAEVVALRTFKRLNPSPEVTALLTLQAERRAVRVAARLAARDTPERKVQRDLKRFDAMMARRTARQESRQVTSVADRTERIAANREIYRQRAVALQAARRAARIQARKNA